MRADAAIPVALGALQRRVEHVVHERGLARAADAGHAGQHARAGSRRRCPSGCARSRRARAGAGSSAARRVAGTGIASSSRRYFAVSDRGSCSRPLERAGEDDAAALLAGAEAHVDDVSATRIMSASCSTTSTVLPWSRSLRRMRDQPLVVARVQADRRLVEHVERADQRRAERRRQVDALRLAARQRRRQPIERQVVEPDVAQERRAACGSRAAPCRRSTASFSDSAQRRRRSVSRLAHGQRRRRRRSCARRRARRALRAAAARRRNRGRSDSRDSG